MAQKRKNPPINPKIEIIKAKGAELVEKVKKLIDEGNARSIAIKDASGKQVFTIPLTAGIIGVAVAPILAGIGAAAALLTDCTIEVEQKR